MEAAGGSVVIREGLVGEEKDFKLDAPGNRELMKGG